MLQCIFGDDVGRLIDMKMKVCEMPRVNRNTSTAHNNRSLFASFFFIWTFLSVWINFEECIKHLKTIYTLKLRPRSHNTGEIDKQKMHLRSSLHYTGEMWKGTEQPPIILDLCLQKTHNEQRFRKAPFPKCFPSALKRKAGVFKFLRFAEKRFRKAPFSRRITVDCGPNWKPLLQISPAQCRLRLIGPVFTRVTNSHVDSVTPYPLWYYFIM